MSVPLCYYGSPDPLPLRRELRAGSLTAVYEAGDLRYVKVGGVEVCRRWYAAVRDHNWGTIPGVISDEVIEETAEWIRVRYTSTHQQGDIHFVWNADIFIQNRRISFEFDGEARSTFRRNRIGFCILHPPEICAGQPVTLFHPDLSQTDTKFPDQIAPQNPFREFIALFHSTASGVVAQWRFDGDVFECEDQRNWTDASYKTFGTPLSRPFPVEVKAGDRVRQTVTVAVLGSATGRSNTTEQTLSRADRPAVRLPAIGLGVASHGKPLLPYEVSELRKLQPAHLRADIDLSRFGWADHLEYSAEHAAAVGCGLELAVTVSDAAETETTALIPVLLAIAPPVERVLVVRAAEWATRAEDVGLVVEAFARAGLNPNIYGGTTANFTELNRRRPPLDWVQGVCYSAQPQEHAFDNASLVECCSVLADTVRTARSFCGDKPLSVGPVTLRKRVNPAATGPWEPPPADPRQPTLFGAGWTLAALKYLAESGVAFVTLHETTGLRGVVDYSSDVRLFAVWTVLRDLADFAGGEVIPTVSSDPLRFDGLEVRKGERVRRLVANLTDQPLTLTVSGVPAEVVVRVLDERNWAGMTITPGYTWDEEAPRKMTTIGGALTLTLPPYAYVRIDG